MQSGWMSLVFCLAAAGLSASANAQSFTENFDSGPVGWTTGSTTNYGNTVGGDTLAFSSGIWTALNASPAGVGTTGWFNNGAAATPVFAANSGTGHANANWNNTVGANTISNWLMSPVVTFNNGDTISFFTRTVAVPSFPDRLILAFSQSGASVTPANFNTTLVTVNSGLTLAGYPSVYTQFTGTISGLGGPTSGRFAFNYNVTNGGPSGSNSDFIGIDDVVYTSTAIPEPLSALILAGLSLGGCLIRRRAA